MALPIILFLSLVAATAFTTTCIALESPSRENSDSSHTSTSHLAIADLWKGRSTSHSRGIRAHLVHRDHHQRRSNYLTSKQRAERDIYSSMKRVEVFNTRQERNLRDDHRLPTFTSNLSLWDDAIYVMRISLGSPPRDFVVAADTGSDLTWLRCSRGSVEDPVRFFLPSESHSYIELHCPDEACQTFSSMNTLPNCLAPSGPLSNQTCNYTYNYGDRTSTSGVFSTDVITLQGIDGEVTPVPGHAFGCSYTLDSQSGLFSGDVDGLVGLGMGPISFPSQLGSRFGGIFSYCLVSLEEVSDHTSPILFGEAVVSDLTGVQWTPILYGTTFYYVELEGISVGGQPLNITSTLFANNGTHGGTIFDSGTTYTQLEPTALDVLGAFLITSMDHLRFIPAAVAGFDYCWDIEGLDASDIRAPNISFNFRDATLGMSFDNAFITFSDSITCLAISRGGVYSSHTIIGNHQQRNFHVIHDRPNKRLGFVSRHCAANSNETSSSTTYRSLLRTVISLTIPLLVHITS